MSDIKMNCNTCGGTLIDEETASFVCQSCGAVNDSASDMLFMKEPCPWINFEGGYQHLDNGACTGSSSDRNHYFREFMKKCNHTVDVLNLPSDIKDQITSLAELCHDHQNLKRMRRKVMLAVCIYYILKKNRVDISFRVIASKLNLKQSSFTKAYRKITKIFNWEGHIEKDALFYVPEICSFLSVDHSHRKKLEDLAFRIDALTKKLLESYGGIQLLYGLALVCVAAEADQDHPLFNLNLVCKKYGFSLYGLKSLIKNIKGSLFKLAFKIPWKPTHLSFKNVHTFIDMIEDYENEYGMGNTNLGSEAYLEQDTNTLSNAKHCLFQKLLSNGCTAEEIKTEGFVTLTKKYIENKSNVVDCDISDSEIDSYLRIPSEIEEIERLKNLDEIKQDHK